MDSISGVRYAVIFIGALLLTRFRPAWLSENFGPWQLFTKIVATCLVVAGLVIIGLSGRGGSTSSVASWRERETQHPAKLTHSAGVFGIPVGRVLVAGGF